jgi:P27 family predicted phage terminase small subunit
MGRGRKPKPTAQHKREGTFRHDRHANRASTPAGVPSPPEALCDEAAVEWKRVVSLLAAAGLVAQLDRAALALYCQAWGDYWAAKAIVDDEGWTAVGSTGNVIEHPAVKAMQRSWAQCLQAAREFGMTPSARASIKMPAREARGETETEFFGVVG